LGFLLSFLIEPQASKNSETTATWSVVLSSSLAAEADFSSPAEAEPEVAALALAQVLVWLPVAEAVGLACSGEAELVVGALEAALVADAEAAGPEPACSEPAEVLAADALAAEPVADAVAEELVAAVVAEALAADALAAEPVADAVAEELVAAVVAEALAADAPAAELAGAAAAELELVCFGPVAAPAADALAAVLVVELVAGARVAALLIWQPAGSQVVDYDSAAAELGQEQAGWVVDCESAEHFAAPRWVDGLR
jgi:hypothetical protein